MGIIRKKLIKKSYYKCPLIIYNNYSARVVEWYTRRIQNPLSQDMWVRIPPRVEDYLL